MAEEKTRISGIMSRRLVIIDCNSSIQEIAKRMAERHVSAVVLVDRNKPVGILTERDLARLVCANDLSASKTPATAIMSAPVATVDEGASMEEAAEEMVKNRVRHLAVRDGSKALVGMVTATDFAWHLSRKAAGGARTMTILDALYSAEEPGEEIL